MKEIEKEELKILFEDEDVKLLAGELQAKNPKRFREIIKEMINEKDFSNENFLNKYQIGFEDQTYKFENIEKEITQLRNNLISGNFDIDDILYVEHHMKKIENDLYGTTGDETSKKLKFAKNSDAPLTEVEKSEIRYLVSCYGEDENTTPLFNVFLGVLEYPQIAKFIPEEHLEKVGLFDLFKDVYSRKTIIDQTKEMLLGLPVTYLGFTNEYHKELCDGAFLQTELQSKNLLVAIIQVLIGLELKKQ